ncbi:hypothetical protein QBC40DRAFT_320026 [Triangularia verruculosa]|uniref:Uncharacterized protein n=1 Tax=Triangularia verruculosa TaxID=2587418 RepID=A0AAN6XAJ2_9PEZI|nr:hypothetical protein QBC40DRAFT_320026 [Triangularia verruculosa]
MSKSLKNYFKALRPSRSTRGSSSDEHLDGSKPLVLKIPFLALLGLYIVVLIAALEYGFRTVTVAEDQFPVLDEYGSGEDIGEYGPFLAPMHRARSVDVLPTTISGSLSVETPAVPSTTSSVTTSASTFPQNTSTPLTPESTLMSTSASSSMTPTSTTTGWAGLPTEPMMVGDRIAYPVIHVPSNSTLNATRNSFSGIHRRVPPKDKYGQIAGYRVKLSFWHSVWRTALNPPWEYPRIFLPTRFVAAVSFYPLEENEQADCTIICDGPAVVFLEAACWSKWAQISADQHDMRLMNPGIILHYEEFEFDGARACAKVAPDIIETKPVTATLFNPLPSITTTELVQEDITVPGTSGHGSYVPTTYMLSGTYGYPTATITTSVWVPSGTPIDVTTVMTLTDSEGRPTATITGTGKSHANQPKTFFDDKGNPTATVIVNGVRWNLRTRTETGGYGTIPVATVTAFATRKFATITTTDGFGRVGTMTGMFDLVPTVVTMRDLNGSPTATVTTLVPTDRIKGVTITDSNGRPVATVYPSEDRGIFRPLDKSEGAEPSTFSPVSQGDYLLAAFLPIIITLPLTILAQVIDSNVKALLPLKALSRSSKGALAKDSLFITSGGIKGFFTSWHLLFHSREPALLLSQLLILVSSATASFSTEAIGFKLRGGCTADSFAGCYLEIAIFRVPGRVVQVFLSLTLLVVVFLGFAMWNWHRNCGSDMRSIAGIAALLTEENTREVFHAAKSNIKHDFITSGKMIRSLSNHRFTLRQVTQTAALPTPRHSETTNTTSSASSLDTASSQWSPQKLAPCTTARPLSNRSNTDRPKLALVALTNPEEEKKPHLSEKKTAEGSSLRWKKMLSVGPVAQDYLRQVLFLLTIVGFLIMILYYELTSLDTAFERFMNSQNLGVRALFASFGFIVSLFWDHHFSNIATREPYRLLSRHPRLLRNDAGSGSNHFFTTPPPLNVFEALTPSRIFHSVQDRAFTVPIVATVTVLSKLTPPLLSNIPFVPWLTWETHQGCAWSVVGILVLMILVLGCNLVAVRYPHMPVHPGEGMGLAGGAYYLCDSKVRGELEQAYYRQKEGANGNKGEKEEQRGGTDKWSFWRRWETGQNEKLGDGGEREAGAERGRFVTFGPIANSQTGDARVGIGEYGVGRG